MVFYLSEGIILLLSFMNSRIIFCEYDSEGFRSALGLTFQTAPYSIEGRILKSVQASSLIQCSHKCLSELLCHDTVFLEGNTCILLENYDDSTLQGHASGIHTKFERFPAKVGKEVSDSQVCDKGYLVYNNSGLINCFAPCDMSTTWVRAKSACERDGGYLGKIDTREKLRFLAKWTKNEHYYIGLRRFYNGSLEWSDGRPANMSSFSITPCVGTYICCGFLRKNSLLDNFSLRFVNCRGNFRYICEKQSKQTTVVFT